MRFDKAYSLSTDLVALSGLAALTLTREAPDWLTFPALAFVLVAAVSGKPRPVISRRWITALTVAAVGFSVVDFLFIGGSLLLAGADFLVILLSLRYLSLVRDKDHVQLFLISFFLLLASTGLSTEIYFIFPFIIFFVSLAWALMLLTIKSESEAALGRHPHWDLGGSFFLGTGFLTILSIAVTIAIFLVIPRVGIGYFSKGVKGILKVSGFSDTVQLGSMGQVLLDPSTVMRVQAVGISGKPEETWYWRGRAFDYYSGDAWTDTLGKRTPMTRDAMGVFYIRPGQRTPPGSIDFNITLEPMETETVFTPYPAFEVTGPFPRLFIDPSEGLYFPFPPGERVSYTVRSPERRPVPAGLKGQSGGNPPWAAKYLQLPKGSEALAGLAQEVAGGADKPYEKAQKISAYLRKHCRYTLNPRRDKAFSPMDDFLFHGKQGYCEHFATAMVLMLRAVGVHARLASGFMGGEWNSYGGYLLVRARDAHTWVEVYFRKSGWVRFDPTPPAPAPDVTALSVITKFIDSLGFRWNRYIVFYNLRDQAGAMRQAMGIADRLKNGLSGILSEVRLISFKGKGLYIPVRLVLPLIPAAALLIYLAALYSRSRARRLKYPVPFYGNMIRILEKKGYVRRPGLTPLEFARGIADGTGVGEGLSDIIRITELYNRVRYGGRPLNKDETMRVDEWLLGLKTIKSKEKQG